ncbi:MAG TPA: RNA 2',3'-cyclic phosphodiesterase [Nitrospira sp.]|jgi:2'-5' RNA ligase|nr:RNA 2',3'-cyclic phosphodiesterase [Nitrospira sp.]
MIRAFVAVELDDALRAQFSQLLQDLQRRLGLDRAKDVRVSWARPGSVHLTLKFLGDIDERLVESLHEAVTRFAPSHSAIHIPLERIGAFPHGQQPRVLWVGPSESWEQSEDAERLAALHQAVDGCCRSFGVPPDHRPLSPHMTLARVKGGERSVGQALLRSGVLGSPLSLRLTVTSLVLMKSELRPTGSIYSKLWEVLLSNR